MREKFYPVWVIVSREINDHVKDWRIMTPLIILTIGFPFLMNDFAAASVNFVNKYGAHLIVDKLVPFSILIIGFFPVTVSLVIALESFVGEKERGTIEPLLTTPCADWQLYLGKLLVGIFIPLAASYTAILFYIFLVRSQHLLMPSTEQMFQLLLLTLAHAVLMTSGAIVISSQSTTVRAANLLASFIVLPVAFLLQGESALFFWGNGDMLWLGIVAVLILAVLLVRMGLAHFRREYLLGREIDTLDLKWLKQVFWDAFRGKATSLKEWYLKEVPGAISQIRTSLLLTLLLLIVGGWGSFVISQKVIPSLVQSYSQDELNELLHSLRDAMRITTGDSFASFKMLFTHNLVSLIFGMGIGVLTFGIAGVLIFLLNLSFAGGVLAAYQFFGYPWWLVFLYGILPHGIFEIPAIFLSASAILYFGARMVTPTPGETLGETFIRAFAVWAKIFVGLVFPLLLIAAFVEAYITPLIFLPFVR